MDQIATEDDLLSTSGTAGGKTLCLSMIVRNERANLERCLAAVADHIGCWVICDTGSSDGTQDFIREFFSRRGIPGELHEFPFENFEQARNAALERGLASRLEFDYLLLVDADMELVVEDPQFRQKLTAPSYLLIQHAGITYWNARMVRRDARARYRGVTHEYLDVPDGNERLEGAWFIDHATGANRVNKFERDIQLLSKALEGEPENARYWFYLAQSYRDAGRLREAAETYAKRAEMGGWGEEVWYSRLAEGRCLKELEDEGGFLRAALQAYALRPHRAEALHDLARHYRQRSQNATALLFSESGSKLPVPAGDVLFIESWVYEYGLLDEFAVSAYWVGRYEESLDVCERLLVGGKVPEHERQRIADNARFARDRLAEQTGAVGAPKDVGPVASSAKTLPTEFSRFVRPYWVPDAKPASPESGWIPDAPAAGTELMVAGLKQRLGETLDLINLQVNHPGPDGDDRPRVVWMHHDVDQSWVQWCGDAKLVESVDRFVFVSEWQKDRYLSKFGLPAERCVVLRNATDLNPDLRQWETEPVWRCAYTSTPFRGLSVLLDAWERLSPGNAELHVWSSMKLYLQDDAPYRHLYERAQSLPGVAYHGIVPNSELRAELRRMHFLIYPSIFAETSCLAVIEAMAAGCRVIIPSLGALPETTAQFAHLYSWTPDAEAHAKLFADVVASELADPWLGRTELSKAQQQYCATAYDWQARLDEWGTLISDLAANGSRRPVLDRSRRGALESYVAGAGRPDVLRAARVFAPNGIFVEVGTYEGQFAERLCDECDIAKLYCVDPYETYAGYQDSINAQNLVRVSQNAHSRMARFSHRVEFVKKFSEDASKMFANRSVDFVYIDANHSFRAVYEDLKTWYPKLKIGGLLCGDDAVDTEEETRDPNGDVEIIWARAADGSVTSGGHYGVLRAVRTFCTERSIKFMLSDTQFLILKEDESHL